MKNKITVISLLSIIVFGAILISPALAAVPSEKFTVQGVLKDSSGNLVSATKDFTLKFYTASTSGTLRNTQVFDDIVVSNGLFTLTATVPYDNFFDEALFVEFSFTDADGASNAETMDDRVEMVGAPYSIAALKAGNNFDALQHTLNNATAVGVGTATPGEDIEIEVSDTSDPALLFDSDGNEFTIGIDSNDSDKFKISDNTALGTNDRFTIDASGNIGIGTSSPDQKMSFVGGNFMQNATTPTLVGSIQDNNKGGSATQIDQARDVVVSGKYAYVIGNVDNSLSIFDISDPDSIVEEGTIVDGAGTLLNGATNVKVVGKYAYVATGGTEDGLQIIDVSNVNSPTAVGSLADGAGGAALNGDGGMNVQIAGQYAYVTACTSGALNIISIADPTAPALVGKITDDGTTLLACPIGLWVQGKYAYVTDRTDNGLEIIDISNPTSPTHVGQLADVAGTALDGAFGLWVQGKYAYVTAFDEGGLQIIDISNPASPTAVGKVTDTGGTALAGAEEIFVLGRYAYVASFSDSGFSVIDISTPTAPTVVASVVDDGTTILAQAVELFVSGKFLYIVAAGDDSLSIFDISGIYAPAAHIGSLQTSYLSVTENALIANNLQVQSGLNVGERGIHTDGNMTIAGQLGIGANPLKVFHVESSEIGDVGLFVNTQNSATADVLTIDLNAINTPGTGNCFLVANDGNQVAFQVCGDGQDGIRFQVSSGESFTVQDGFLSHGSPTELTIDTNGDITPTQTYHQVDTFNNNAASDLDTINGCTGVSDAGKILILTTIDSSRDVTIKTGTIETQGGGDMVLDTTKDTASFICSGSQWLATSFSTNE